MAVPGRRTSGRCDRDCRPDLPARCPGKGKWLTPAERDWIEDELARETAQLGTPANHNILAALRDWRVLQLAVIGMRTVKAAIEFPAVSAAAAGGGHRPRYDPCRLSDEVARVSLVSGMIMSGWHRRRQGQRFTHLLTGCLLVALSFLAMALAPSPGILVAAYFALSFVWPSVPLSTLVIGTEVVPPPHGR